MKQKKNKTPLMIRILAMLFPILEKIAPFLAKRLFIEVFFTPAKYPFPEKELEFIDKAKKITIQFKGKDVQVYNWGKGEPVLMMHGWMGRATQFRKFIPAFNAAGYSVVAFDAPAHGNSKGLKSHVMYFVQLVELLHLRYGFKGYIGHSLGGVAGMLAASRGLKIQKLVMIGSPTIADEIIGEFLRRLNGSWKLGNHFKDYIINKYNQPFENYTAIHAVKEVHSLPILLIYDRDDLEVPVFHGEELKKHYTDAELLITSGLGHTRILKDEMVIEKSLNFISS